MKTYARSLDTLGFFVREANDLALIRAAYGHAPADPPKHMPRIGFCRRAGGTWPSAPTRRTSETAARALRAAGAKVRTWEMPESWDALITAHNRVMTKEATFTTAPNARASPSSCRPA